MRSESSKVENPSPVVEEGPDGKPVKRKITGVEWDRLIEQGFFKPRERLELVHGEMRVMSPIGDPHEAVVSVLVRALRRGLRGCHVKKEAPFDVGEERLYPDAMIVRGREEDYVSRTPVPRDVPLVVEVVDTTGRYEREDKSEIYAKGGVREYWIVDVNDRTIEVRCEPRRKSGLYAKTEILAKGAVLAPVLGRRITLRSFLGFLR